MNNGQSFWRDAGLFPELVGIDIRAFFPLLCWLFYPRYWTFYVAIGAIVFFFFMQKKGYTLPVFLRKLKHLLRGKVIPARSWSYQRRFFD